jgi:hypothetical protein
MPSPPVRVISFPLVRTTTLEQSVYPDIALHISNYYISNKGFLVLRQLKSGFVSLFYNINQYANAIGITIHHVTASMV